MPESVHRTGETDQLRRRVERAGQVVSDEAYTGGAHPSGDPTAMVPAEWRTASVSSLATCRTSRLGQGDELAEPHAARIDREADAGERRAACVQHRGGDGPEAIGVLAIGDGVALGANLAQALQQRVEVGQGALGRASPVRRSLGWRSAVPRAGTRVGRGRAPPHRRGCGGRGGGPHRGGPDQRSPAPNRRRPAHPGSPNDAASAMAGTRSRSNGAA